MSNHRAYQLYAHMTWHTWKRVGCLDLRAASDVKIAAASAGRSTAVNILAIAVLVDHVHLLVSFRPDTRLSDFIRLAKTIAAFRANGRVPGAIRWARGFFVASVHKRDLPRIDAYIAQQYQRHPDRVPRGGRDETTSLPRGFADPGRQPGVNPSIRGLYLTTGGEPDVSR